MRTRDWEREAIQAVDEMVARGHDCGANGVCSDSCPVCAPLRTTPEEQFLRIRELVRQKMTGRTRGVFSFAIHRTELEALAREPRATAVHRTRHLGILVSVTLALSFDDYTKATVVVKGLTTLQGRHEAYRPETLPAPMPWSERTGENIDPELGE
jgi:hypothetical protein